MKRADFLTWLKDWLTRHPLATPPEPLQASYIEEVMRRIRTASAPSPVFRWFPQPHSAFALGTAVACLLVVVAVVNRPPMRLAKQVEQDWQVLSDVGELTELLPHDLAEEAKTLDRLMLAEAEPLVDDEAWVDETLELLNEVEEDHDTALDAETVENLLEELERLDESELAASS